MESKGEMIIYQAQDGKTASEVKLENETIWLTQDQMATLFDKSKRTVSEHIGNVFKEDELDRNTVVRTFRTTVANGKLSSYGIYNLDVIISICYRVNSKRGTRFRIRATQTLKDHLAKGYTLNEKRLQEQKENLEEFHQTVEFLKTTLGTKGISGNEAQGLLEMHRNWKTAAANRPATNRPFARPRFLALPRPSGRGFGSPSAMGFSPTETISG